MEMTKMETYLWSKKKCLELIELYKEREQLWNPLSHRYHSKDLKLKGWSEIAETLNIPHDACKAKITSLLASFRREKSKVKKSGQGTNDVYKSSWFAFKSLEFLIDKNPPPVTKFSSATIHTPNEDQNGGESDSDVEVETEIETKMETITQTETEMETKTEVKAEAKVVAEPKVVVSPDKDTSPPLLRRRTVTRIRRNSRTTSDNADIDEAMEILKDMQKRDHIQAFGLNVVERLRRLKRRNQILVMQIISTALYEKELSELDSESGSERASGLND